LEFIILDFERKKVFEMDGKEYSLRKNLQTGFKERS